MTKITLATLPEATDQEIFNQVAKHLLTQNQRSTNKSGKCAYRGTDGLVCAAGCLIADDEYQSEMENKSWYGLVSSGILPTFKHVNLIYSMQRIHDQVSPREWNNALYLLALEQKLEFNLDQYMEPA